MLVISHVLPVESPVFLDEIPSVARKSPRAPPHGRPVAAADRRCGTSSDAQLVRLFLFYVGGMGSMGRINL